MPKCVQKESAVTIRSTSHLDDSCAGQVFFAGAGVEQYMWPGGRICSNCALARKRSAQSASTAWIFTGGNGKLEGCCTALEQGELWGKGWWVKNTVFYIISVPQGHGICHFMRKTKPGPSDGWCSSSGRYVWRRELAEFLTTSKRCEFMPALKVPALVMMNF